MSVVCAIWWYRFVCILFSVLKKKTTTRDDNDFLDHRHICGHVMCLFGAAAEVEDDRESSWHRKSWVSSKKSRMSFFFLRFFISSFFLLLVCHFTLDCVCRLAEDEIFKFRLWKLFALSEFFFSLLPSVASDPHTFLSMKFVKFPPTWWIGKRSCGEIIRLIIKSVSTYPPFFSCRKAGSRRHLSPTHTCMSSHNSILASRVCDDHAVTLAFIFFRHFINWLPLCVLKLKTFHPASGSGFPLDRTCNEWNGEMCVRTLCSRKNGKHWLLDSSSDWEREQVEWTKQIDRSEMFPSTRLKSCVSVVEPESDFIHKKIICRSERSSPSSLRAVSRRLLSISRFVRVIRKLLCSSDMRDFFFE